MEGRRRLNNFFFFWGGVLLCPPAYLEPRLKAAHGLNLKALTRSQRLAWSFYNAVII